MNGDTTTGLVQPNRKTRRKRDKAVRSAARAETRRRALKKAFAENRNR